MLSTRWRLPGAMLLLTMMLAAALPLAAEPDPNRSYGTLLGENLEAVELFNLEQCVPARFEDANILTDDATEALACVSWSEGDCCETWQGKAAISWGAYRRYQVIAGYLWKSSDIDQLGDGDTFLKVLRQVHYDDNDDAAVFGIDFNFPTGQDYSRLDTSYPPYSFVVNERQDKVDPSLLGLYTHVLDVEKPERLHFEARHTFVNSAPVGFRSNRWFLATGYDRMINKKLLGLAGIWWEQAPSPYVSSATVLQLGIRNKVSRRFLWGAALNLGLDWPEADWGLTLSGQFHFCD